MQLLILCTLIFFTLVLSKMKQSNGDGIGGQGMTLEPESGVYSKVVFWFHGLGDTADGWGSMSTLICY